MFIRHRLPPRQFFFVVQYFNYSMSKDRDETDPSYKDRSQEYEGGPRRDSDSWRVPLERVMFELLRRGFEVGLSLDR